MRLLPALLASAAVVVAAVAPAPAQEAPTAARQEAVKKPQEPIRITAKRMEVKQEQNLIIFEDEVVAVQGDVTISADRVRITTGKGDERRIQEMQATGNVQFRQFFPADKVERFATGDKANYYDAEGKLILTGNPKAWEKDNVVTGEVMTFFTRENRFLVDGKENGKVKVVFYPDEDLKEAAKAPGPAGPGEAPAGGEPAAAAPGDPGGAPAGGEPPAPVPAEPGETPVGEEPTVPVPSPVPPSDVGQ